MVRCIDLTLRSKEKSQSCSEQPSTLPALVPIASAVDQNIERAEFLRDFFASASTAAVEHTFSLSRWAAFFRS